MTNKPAPVWTIIVNIMSIVFVPIIAVSLVMVQCQVEGLRDDMKQHQAFDDADHGWYFDRLLEKIIEIQLELESDR